MLSPASEGRACLSYVAEAGGGRKSVSIDIRRGAGYNGVVTLRRLTIVALLAAYFGGGVCAQACALGWVDLAPGAQAAAGIPGHCDEEGASNPSPGSDRHESGERSCCSAHFYGSEALRQGDVIISARAPRLVEFAAVGTVVALPIRRVPLERVAGASPPGAVAILADSLHGPRPPPSFLAVV